MSYNPILDLPKSRMYRDMSALGFYNLDGATLVRGEMRSYQYAIQVYLELIDSIAGGWWPLDCTLERLSQWEEVLGLPLRPRATEEQRRQTVLDLLSLGEQLRGPGGVERLLLAAGIRGRVEEDYPHRRLLVTVEEFGEEYDSIYQCMDRARQLLPAHLEVVFEFGGPDWTQWEAAAGTWSAFDASDLTWQQRDRAENL